MSDWRSEIDGEYLSLIESFLRKEIGADAFVSRYFAIWYRERDIADSVKNSWARRFDVELFEQLRSNAISKEEFSERWATLFGLTGARAALEEMKSAIFTACDVYSPEPAGKFEIDAEALQSEVAAHSKSSRMPDNRRFEADAQKRRAAHWTASWRAAHSASASA